LYLGIDHHLTLDPNYEHFHDPRILNEDDEIQIFHMNTTKYHFTGGLGLTCFNLSETHCEDLNEDNAGTTNLSMYVLADFVFLVFAMIEICCRFVTFQKRAKAFPTFAKKVIPKMELFDFFLVRSERSLARSEATSRENEHFEHPQGPPGTLRTPVEATKWNFQFLAAGQNAVISSRKRRLKVLCFVHGEEANVRVVLC